MRPCNPFCRLIFMTFLRGITGTRLTTSPTQITIGGSSPTSQLTVSCSPDAPGITQVLTIEIGKKSSTGSNQAIIQMRNGDSTVQVKDTGLQQRMTASGSITGATGSLQFILTDLRCTDAASTYYCSTLYLAGSAGSDEAATNITARAYPEQIEMFPTPDRVSYDNGQLISFRCTGRIGNQTRSVSGASYPEQIEMFPAPDRVSYDSGQMISFRCTGRIGNQFDVNNLHNLWTWEWRSIDNEFTSWTRYPNDQNITFEPPIPVSGSRGCQYTGASTLLHTVANPDNGRQFRCSIISKDYNDNKTVLVIAACIHNCKGCSLGGGMAIGVCVMLVVDAICLGLAFLYRDEIANYISGAKKASNTEMPVMSNIQTPATTVISPVEIQTQGDEYEIPVDRNHYDVLQRETEDIPNTYEKIRTYQNM